MYLVDYNFQEVYLKIIFLILKIFKLKKLLNRKDLVINHDQSYSFCLIILILFFFFFYSYFLFIIFLNQLPSL
jgi:hypothetical protein